jgi:putative addiction module CopG family antidote
MPEPLPLAEFVARQLACGRFHSYEEIVQAGLRLLQEHEDELDRLAEALHPALQESMQGDRGMAEREHSKTAGREHIAAPPSRPQQHIWDIAEALLAEVPEEAFDPLPVDGAAQHDHYIYGTPKRST